MKAQHWLVVCLTVVAVGSGAMAEAMPQYASYCHVVGAVATAVAAAWGLSLPAVSSEKA